MSVLTKYLLKQNIFLLAVILFISVGIYVLTDLFELLDRFLEANLPFYYIAWFYIVKIPAIIAQLLPAVFLLSLVLQLNFLSRTNELTALYTGSISPFVIFKFIFFYSLIWACVQFSFSEGVGVLGDRTARNIWKEDVQQKERGYESLKNLWFTEKNNVLHIEEVFPYLKKGTNLRIYELSDNKTELVTITEAEHFTIEKKEWLLENVVKTTIDPIKTETLSSLRIPLRQNLKAFLLVESWSKPEQLPLWELREVITHLKKAGSNTEALRTAWHGKISYAASIITMGFLAFAILFWTKNIYKAISICLLVVFTYYSTNTILLSAGKNGALSPVVAAWSSNIGMNIFLLCVLLRNVFFSKKISS